MKKETRTTTNTYDVFVTEDGKEFSNEKAAIAHEWRLKATTVFTVIHRGKREPIEIYSTRELAKEGIKGHESHYYIDEVYVNEGLLRQLQ